MRRCSKRRPGLQILEGLTVDPLVKNALFPWTPLADGDFVQSNGIKGRVEGTNWVPLVRSERIRLMKLMQLMEDTNAKYGSSYKARLAFRKRNIEQIESPELPCEKAARRIPPVRSPRPTISHSSAPRVEHEERQVGGRPRYARAEERFSDDEELSESEEDLEEEDFEEEQAEDTEQEFTEDEQGQPRVKQEYNMLSFREIEGYPDSYRSSEEEAEDAEK